MTIDEILERWKQWGLYSFSLHYGEDIGYDDSDVPTEDRRIRMMATPVGCLGEAKILWCDKLSTLRTFDPRAQQPEELPNPPGQRAHGEGFFIWGATHESVKARAQVPIPGVANDRRSPRLHRPRRRPRLPRALLHARRLV